MFQPLQQGEKGPQRIFLQIKFDLQEICSPPVTVSKVKALNGHCHTRSSTHCKETTKYLLNGNHHEKN